VRGCGRVADHTEDLEPALDEQIGRIVQDLASEARRGAEDDRRKIDTALRQSYNQSILVLVVGVAISIVLAFVISHVVIGPIQKLRDAAHQLGQGKMDTRIVLNSKDELGELAGSFNLTATLPGLWKSAVKRKTNYRQRTKALRVPWESSGNPEPDVLLVFSASRNVLEAVTTWARVRLRSGSLTRTIVGHCGAVVCTIALFTSSTSSFGIRSSLNAVCAHRRWPSATPRAYAAARDCEYIGSLAECTRGRRGNSGNMEVKICGYRMMLGCSVQAT
jgi:HAMP domain-containing protein